MINSEGEERFGLERRNRPKKKTKWNLYSNTREA